MAARKGARPRRGRPSASVMMEGGMGGAPAGRPGELAAHGGAMAQTWATASGGAAVASRRIPRDLVSFFCIFIFSLHNFLSSNIYVKFFSPETFSFVSDAKKIYPSLFLS